MCNRINIVYYISWVLANTLQPIQYRALANPLQSLGEGRRGVSRAGRLLKRDVLSVLLPQGLRRTSGDVVVTTTAA